MGRRTYRITEKTRGHRPRLQKLVKKLTTALIPHSRLHDIWELAAASPSDFAHQAIDSTVRAIAYETRRILFPAIAINRDSPSFIEKRKRFDPVCNVVWWCVQLFFAGYILYVARAATMVFQADLNIALAAGLQSLLMSMALRVQRRSLKMGHPGSPSIQITSIDPAKYKWELIEKKDLLILGDFSPSDRPLQSGLIALMFLLMFFAPSYLAVRWIEGQPLPAGAHGNSIMFAFLAALALLALFLLFWKSSRLAARAFDEEIERLGAV